MRATSVSPIRTWGVLLIALLFVFWSISLIISVDRQQEEMSNNVKIITRLLLLEQSIRELERAITSSSKEARELSEERWRTLYSNYRARVEVFDSSDPGVRRIQNLLARIDAKVVGMERTRATLLEQNSGPEQINRLKEEFRAQMNRAIDETKIATRIIRLVLSDISADLSVKWRNLNIIVVVSCLMAISMATLLTIHRRDTKKRIHVEEPLSHSEKYFRTLIENATDIITILNRDGTIRYESPSIERILGYKQEELIDKNAFEYVHPDDLMGVIEDFKTTIQNPGLPLLLEFRFRHKDGTWRVLGAVGRSLLDDPLVEGVIANSRDITERRRTEEVLKQREGWLTAILAASRDGILVEEDEVIIYVNRSYARMCGYLEPEELIGRHISIIVSPGDNERMLEFGRRRLRGEPTPQVYEFKARHKEGPPVDLEASVSTTTVADKDYIITIARDIFERKKTESALRASLKEKEVLLKEIHHRVKNNLQIISSLLSLQSEYIKDEQSLEMFKESRDRVKSMALIHEKLYQSKNLSRIDFTEYISNLASNLFYSYSVDVNAITLKTAVEGVSFGIDTAIPCGLIINELVSNSLKHAFPAGRSGEIRIELNQDSDGKYTLVVSDNGIGFPKTLDFRKTRSLGLQLVNDLTCQLDGTIDLENHEGTFFRIRFAELKYRERS